MSKSSAESQHQSMSEATGELVWLAGFLTNLRVTLHYPILLAYGNKAARHIAQNPIFRNSNFILPSCGLIYLQPRP